MAHYVRYVPVVMLRQASTLRRAESGRSAPVQFLDRVEDAPVEWQSLLLVMRHRFNSLLEWWTSLSCFNDKYVAIQAVFFLHAVRHTTSSRGLCLSSFFGPLS